MLNLFDFINNNFKQYKQNKFMYDDQVLNFTEFINKYFDGDLDCVDFDHDMELSHVDDVLVDHVI